MLVINIDDNKENKVIKDINKRFKKIDLDIFQIE